MNGHKQLRIGRHSVDNQIYILTFTTWKRQPYFNDWQNALTLARTIESPTIHQQSRVLCWVIMPDHVHLLLQLGTADTLSNYVRRVKAGSKRQLAINDPIWARGFHDRAIRKESDILPAARYIAANPIRAGLAKNVKEYPYWNCVWI